MIIGEWTMRQACLQAKIWAPYFGQLFIAVKVSAKQFRKPEFANNVERLISETGGLPPILDQEVTDLY